MMSDSYSCWGKDWDDWLKAEEQRQEEHRFDREEIEEETMNEKIHGPDSVMHDKNCYCQMCIDGRKTPEEYIAQLQERIRELEKEKEYILKCYRSGGKSSTVPSEYEIECELIDREAQQETEEETNE